MSTISVWTLGRVCIYPHLSWDGCLDYDNLLETAKNITAKLSDLNISIYPLSSFCNEVNGRWNVIINIKEGDFSYNYMIRRDKDFGKTFGCPIVNNHYMDSPMNERPLSELCNPDLFKRMETAITSVLSGGTHISFFET